jgi:hypothetical protein
MHAHIYIYIYETLFGSAIKITLENEIQNCLFLTLPIFI